MQSRWIKREGARHRDAGCVFCVNARALAKRRDWRADDAFRKPFLVDVCYVERFKTTWAICRVEIFATQHNVLNIVTAVLIRFGKNGATIDMLFVVGRISNLV